MSSPAKLRTSAAGVVAFAIVAALLGGGAWWWWGEDGAAQRALAPRSSARLTAADADVVDAAPLGSTTADGSGSHAVAGGVARAEIARDPMAAPAPDEIAAAETDGRALFWGVVCDPAGVPCPGATIWRQERVVATSDERGRYRVEAPQLTWDLDRRATGGVETWLVARKEGVGIAQVWVTTGSAHCDFALERGVTVAGRVRRRGGDAAVAGARVEFVVPLESPWGGQGRLLPLATTTDADGRFAFATVQGRRIALRAAADDCASCGWFEYDVDPANGRSGIDFELQPLLQAKGWFVPWPPPGCAAADVAAARVEALDRELSMVVGEEVAPSGAVGTDGAFALRFAATSSLELRLLFAGGCAWTQRYDLPWEPRDLDCGRIELGEAARLRGTLDFPAALLELGFELAVVLGEVGGDRVVRAPIDRDGSFRSPPLPPGACRFGIVLGDELVVPLALAQFEPVRRAYAGIPRELAPGETRELGRVAPRDALIAGRVARRDGGPAGGSGVTLAVGAGAEAMIVQTLCDRDGRYAFVIDGAVGDENSFVDQFARAGELRLVAWRAGQCSAPVAPARLVEGGVQRVDLLLDATATTAAGRLLDPAGLPLVGVRLCFAWMDGDQPLATGLRNRYAFTDADGRFLCRDLAPGRWLVLDRSDEEATCVGTIAAPAVDVVLTRPDPESPPAAPEAIR